MKDITDPRLIYAKGFLFLGCGVAAAALLVLENPTLTTIVLLPTAIFCFARFYYFAFYVIGRYVDDSYRFSGLGSFVVYLLRRRHRSG